MQTGTNFILRHGNEWYVTGPGGDVVPASLDLVLGALSDAHAHETSGPSGIGVATAALVTRGRVCGRVRAGCVLIEDAGGRTMTLDGTDLRVIDALDGRRSVDEVAALAGCGVGEVHARIDALIASGRFVPGDAGPGDAAGDLRPPSPPVRAAATDAPAAVDLDGRVPVYGFWHEDLGPLLSLGMLSAAARSWKDGELQHCFEIRRPETATSVLADLAGRRGPAVLLCSDYVWSLDRNVATARRAKELCPDLIVVHGGPSSPKYDRDVHAFFDSYGDVADVLVRGEGELTLCELLEYLAERGASARDEGWPELESTVAGVSFRRDGIVCRSDDRPRASDLDALPSPYLSGEFDDIPPEAWVLSAFIETNRGCPYGCSFCDWGSATMSRLRKFSIDRVEAEMRWVAQRGIYALQFCDANFGIMERDVEIARRLATIRRETGGPLVASFTPAKSTTRHLTLIFDELTHAGFSLNAAISLQTTDGGVLTAVDRSNISTDNYLALAADLRSRGLPLLGDLLLGLPEQTFDTYKRDLQFFLDHEISARTWTLQVLPNAPMNAPEYRERYGLVIDGDNLVRSTSTFDEAARARMLRLRNVDIITERLGLLRHVMRYLQWDLGIPALDVMEHVLGVIERAPQRFPVLSWTLSYFDLHPTVAVGWTAFYDEVKSLVVEDLGVPADSTALECVLGLQRFLMPWAGREFPESIDLEHDYVSYYRSATASLYTTGHAGLPDRPLAEYGPAVFTVEADPLGLCDDGLSFFGAGRSETMMSDFHVGAAAAHELLSPLTFRLPATVEAGFGRLQEPPAVERAERGGQRVQLRTSQVGAHDG